MKKSWFKGRIPLVLVCALSILFMVGSAGDRAPEYTYTEKLIAAADGGFLKISNRGSIIIPSNALETDTVLSMEAFTTVDYIGDDKIDMLFKFGPSPLQFNGNVTITFLWDEYYEGPGDTVYLYFYDEDDKEWVKKTASLINVPGNRTITCQVDHFSRYAVAGPSLAQ